MNDVYISSIPTDADMDIIGQCIKANIAMQAETWQLKHGEGEPWNRPLTEKEQEVVDEATKQILSNER